MQRASYALFSSFGAGKPGKDDDVKTKSPSNSYHGARAESPGRASSTTADYNDDEAGQIVEILEQKRKQLDEEVEKFTKRKEKEFREFEKDLRKSKARKQRDEENWKSDSRETHSAVNGAGRGSPTSKSRDGVEDNKREEDSRKEKQPASVVQRRTNSISELTGSLNRLDTNGISDSSNKANKDSGKSPNEATLMTPLSYDPDTHVQELFTPPYLRLIDSNHRSQHQDSPSTPQNLALPPAKPRRLSQSPSSSCPPKSTSTTTLHSGSTFKPSSRSTLAPSSLPSALRTPTNAKGKNKKSRSLKRVQFQLATAIVQPNSSYEEPERSPISDSQSQDHLTDMPPNPVLSPEISLSSSPTQVPDAVRADHPSPGAASTSSDEGHKQFKRNPTSPPTPGANGITSTQARPSEECSSYFDAAMRRTPTPTTQTPTEDLDGAEESGDPMFDLDEDLDSPGKDSKYSDDDEKVSKPNSYRQGSVHLTYSSTQQGDVAPELSLDDEDAEEVASQGLSGGQAGSLPIDIVRAPRSFSRDLDE